MYAFKVRSRVYHLFNSDTDLTVCNRFQAIDDVKQPFGSLDSDRQIKPSVRIALG